MFVSKCVYFYQTCSAFFASVSLVRYVPSKMFPTMVRPFPAFSWELKVSRRGCLTAWSESRFRSTNTWGLDTSREKGQEGHMSCVCRWEGVRWVLRSLRLSRINNNVSRLLRVQIKMPQWAFTRRRSNNTSIKQILTSLKTEHVQWVKLYWWFESALSAGGGLLYDD